MADLSLDAYGYVTQNARYRNLRTGRFVSNDEVRGVLNETIDAGFERTRNFLTAVVATNRDINDLNNALTSHIVNSHTQMYILGRGGVGNMTDADYAELQKRVEFELTRLDVFMADIQEGRVSLAQAQARMDMYAEHIYTTYHQGEESAHKAAGYTHMRRFDEGDDRVCPDCERYANSGVVKIGFLPMPGENSVCRTKCRCTVKYYYYSQGQYLEQPPRNNTLRQRAS